MTGPRILLIVGGGIAAYKACELVRTIRRQGGSVTCILTEGGSQFVTPMALAALSENPVYTSLWDLKNEVEMGHIQLSRSADLIVVCPATADLLAKMAAGIADDLATTTILATDTPVMAIPAMNVRMWTAPAAMRNVETLRAAGVDVMEPDEGAMACGEFGPGRLPEPIAVWNHMAWALDLGPTAQLSLPGDPVAWGSDFEGDEDDDYLDFGGLTGSLVARENAEPREKRPALPFADGLEAEGDEVQTAEPEPPAQGKGPVTARKGKASAAPPTDPEAINHLVSRHGEEIAPQPIAGDSFGISVGEDGAAEPGVGSPSPVADAPVVPDGTGPLAGRHVLVTAGPTWEPIDPVRYIANRSSGKQGYAIAAAAAAAGARVTLVSGPVHLPTPPGVDRVDVESAMQMAEAVRAALPADIAVMVAAVADWRTAQFAKEKIKKRGSAPPALVLTENPDILAMVSARPDRPPLLIGFAAETENVVANARDKRKRKGCDWIIANDVSGSVMGGDANAVHIVRSDGVTSLPEMPKDDVARILVERFVDALQS